MSNFSLSERLLFPCTAESFQVRLEFAALFFVSFFYRRRGGCEAAVYAYIIMWAACVHSSHGFDFAWYRKHVIFFIFSPRRCVLSLFPTFFTIVMNRMNRLGQSLATTVRSRLARTKWLCLASRENVAVSHPKKNLTIRSLCSSRQSRGQRRKLANHTHTHQLASLVINLKVGKIR